MSDETHMQGEVRIDDESHIVTVRKSVREVTTRLGFGITDVTRVVTAASELARNVFHYAGIGVMRWRELADGSRIGIELTFEDHGPGIPDVEQAMQEGYSTGVGLGMGLPGTKRLMDEMEIHSEIGRGTTVVVRKWRKK
jgi:serine/threonine-protein kinase RsbT